MTDNQYHQLFAKLTENLNLFLETVSDKKLSLQVTDLWTVKDILCHIVFWHELYAINYHALAHHLPPQIPKGPLNHLNLDGVTTLRKNSLKTLLTRLQAAQQSLEESILIHQVPKMTYHQGGRDYTTAEFLNIVAHHLTTHTVHIRRAPTKSALPQSLRKKLPKKH